MDIINEQIYWMDGVNEQMVRCQFGWIVDWMNRLNIG